MFVFADTIIVLGSILSIEKTICAQIKYRDADKSLARPGRKEAPPVKSVMGRGMD